MSATAIKCTFQRCIYRLRRYLMAFRR